MVSTCPFPNPDTTSYGCLSLCSFARTLLLRSESFAMVVGSSSFGLVSPRIAAESREATRTIARATPPTGTIDARVTRVRASGIGASNSRQSRGRRTAATRDPRCGWARSLGEGTLPKRHARIPYRSESRSKRRVPFGCVWCHVAGAVSSLLFLRCSIHAFAKLDGSTDAFACGSIRTRSAAASRPWISFVATV